MFGHARTDQLQEAVEGLHECKAAFRAMVAVCEEHQGQTVWQGEGAIFDLKDHPTATTAYAWSDPVPGSDRRRFYAILHEGPVKSPKDAVRASIVQAYRDAINPA